MAITKSRLDGMITPDVADSDSRNTLGLAGFGGIAAIMALSFVASTSQIGVLSLAIVAVGFAIAAIAWLTSAAHDERRASAWDVSGLLLLTGFAGFIVAGAGWLV